MKELAVLLTGSLGTMTSLKKGWTTTVKSGLSYRPDSTSSLSERCKKDEKLMLHEDDQAGYIKDHSLAS